jgi:3-hydroxyacyl-[acyl-carrier-protein] dehydratase
LRFLLVDRITHLERGKRAEGIKNVTLSEDFLAHHFPNFPLMPGTLITESLVQLADWVIRESTDFTQAGLATSFERLKFHRMARPGDQLRLEVQIVSATPETAEVKGSAFCEGVLVAVARFGMQVQPIHSLQGSEEAKKLYELLRG